MRIAVRLTRVDNSSRTAKDTVTPRDVSAYEHAEIPSVVVTLERGVRNLKAPIRSFKLQFGKGGVDSNHTIFNSV